LNGSCGLAAYNASALFEAIGENYNAMHFRSSTQETPLFFEVEYWNSSEQEAYLWVKVPEISSSSDTTLSLVYDAAQNWSVYHSPSDVWDSNYVGVWHMNDNSTSTILDSTVYDNDGVKKDANQPVEIAGQIGKAQNFTSSNSEYISVSDDDSLDLNTTLTISCFVKVSDYSDYASFIAKGLNNGYEIELVQTSGVVKGVFGMDIGTKQDMDTVSAIGTDWALITMAFDGNNFSVYLNQELKEVVEHIGVVVSNPYAFLFGARGTVSPSQLFMDGCLDEVQISNVARSSGWIELTYLSQIDALLTIADALTFEEAIFGIAALAFVLVILVAILLFALK
jgi:hypothetical protein